MAGQSEARFLSLERRLRQREARVAVIGLGYAGLPLAVEFAAAGFRVTGIDIDPARVASLQRGVSYVEDVPSSLLKSVLKSGRFAATTRSGAISQADAIVICVPTPLRKTKDPDVSYIVAATHSVCKHARKGALVVLESTTYPGTCEELIAPAFEQHGFKVGRDVLLAFSPERVDPGNKQFATGDIPKVVGGMSDRAARLAELLYVPIVPYVFKVSSTRAAEMVKLLENTFRTVNISLMNELAMMCSKMGIDVWEVIDAAATKPFGFMPFYPGPGMGGHCLPVDPVYLSWKAKLMDIEAGFIDLATRINTSMPAYVVNRVGDALNEQGKCMMRARVLILGVSYKRDVRDTRETPALEIKRLLEQKGASVSYHDPLVPVFECGTQVLRSRPLTRRVLAEADCVLIVTNHTKVDYRKVVEEATLVVDTRNATKGLTGRARVAKL